MFVLPDWTLEADARRAIRTRDDSLLPGLAENPVRRQREPVALPLAALIALGGLGAAGPSQTQAWRLWSSAPAAHFVEAYPVGNAHLGALVFGGIEEERLVLNESTLWSGSVDAPDRTDAHEALPEILRFLREGKNPEAQELGIARDAGVGDLDRCRRAVDRGAVEALQGSNPMLRDPEIHGGMRTEECWSPVGHVVRSPRCACSHVEARQTTPSAMGIGSCSIPRAGRARPGG